MIDIHELMPSEESDFINLWSRTFEDSAEDIRAFTKSFGDDLRSFVLTDPEFMKGVLSSLTLFKMGSLFVPDIRESLDVYISYAICTDSRARGRGYGAAITRFASDYVKGYEKSLSALSPASESLIDFYTPLGYDNFFYCEASELEVKQDYLGEMKISLISPEEYNEKRERLLENTVHVSLSGKSLEYLSTYNNFVSFTDISQNLTGISTCTELSDSGEIMISELLVERITADGKLKPAPISAAEYEKLANDISLKFGAENAKYRIPSNSSRALVQGMMYGADKKVLCNADRNYDARPYLGFPFD